MTHHNVLTDIPEELSLFWENIQKTEQEFVKTVAEPAKNEPSYTESKFGGKPYLTSVEDYPKTSKGTNLTLLAQINFSEVPKLDMFPNSGLLQFFITDDEMLGLDLNDLSRQEGFRVKYFPENEVSEEKAIKDFSWPAYSTSFVVQSEFEVSFTKMIAPMSVMDYRFDKEVHSGKNIFDFPDEVSEWYWNQMQGDCHKFGGYPKFTQDDPRFDKKYREYSILLFQMDSNFEKDDSKSEIMWGDMGVANFFIKPADLKALKFDDVIYNWDCS